MSVSAALLIDRTPAGLGQASGQWPAPAARPSSRQPDLAAPFFSRHRRHAGRIWCARNPAHSSGIARLAGRGTCYAVRLEPEADAQADDGFLRASSIIDRRIDPQRLGVDLHGRRWIALFALPVRWLEAEIVRDRMLATSGRLDAAQFGPPVEVIEDFAGQVHVKDDSARRSVYVQVRRSKPVSLFTAFDAPVMAVNCDRRTASTVAPQSLMLMNGDFTLKQAEHLANRLRSEAPGGLDLGLTTPLADRFPKHQSAWTYGYGSIDEPLSAIEPSAPITRFQPFGHWTGSSWQGGTALPDSVVGWALLHAPGGHTGNDLQHAAIRRWTAPVSGSIAVTGAVKHHVDRQVTGVRLRSRMVSSRSGVARHVGIAKNNRSRHESVAKIDSAGR